MRKLLLIVAVIVLINNKLFAQKKVWDIPTLEAQISRNSTEYNSQTTLKNNQTISTATQTEARSQGNDFKAKVKIIHARLVNLSILMSDGKQLLDSYSIIKDILSYEKQVITTVGSDPKLLPIVVSSQASLVERSNGLIKYIELIAIAAGDLNAMKSTDRRTIVGYVINELRVIRGDAFALKQSLVWAKEGSYLNTINPWAKYISEDKRFADQILNNLKF